MVPASGDLPTKLGSGIPKGGTRQTYQRRDNHGEQRVHKNFLESFAPLQVSHVCALVQVSRCSLSIQSKWLIHSLQHSCESAFLVHLVDAPHWSGNKGTHCVTRTCSMSVTSKDPCDSDAPGQ